MQLISREVFTPHDQGRCVFPGFICYISSDKPILMHRHGWVDGSDQYDDFSDAISTDNGHTWGPRQLRLKGQKTDKGIDRYAENAAFFDAKTQRLYTITTHAHYEPDKLVSRNHWQLEFNHYDVSTGQWGTPWRSRLGHDASGLMLSFSNPIFLNDDCVLVPAQKPMPNADGEFKAMPGYYHVLLESLVLIGQRNAKGDFDWTTSSTARVSHEKSSRGVCEPAIARLCDQRIVMVCRGDNGYFPGKPGCKWVCYSHDDGRSWGEASPMTLSDGSLIESPASGSALFRCERTGQLYWLGNLALDGMRANGNWPRHPMVLARVQEQPFGLIRESFLIVDTRLPGESERVQLSNFRFYQDRITGELVIFLTRFGETDEKNFKIANYYRYRVKLDE